MAAIGHRRRVLMAANRAEPQPRREEALADEPDLVLDLPLLPSRCRRAGDRIDEVVAAHLQEAAVVEALLANENRLHRRLHVVVDAAPAGALARPTSDRCSTTSASNGTAGSSRRSGWRHSRSRISGRKPHPRS